MVRKSDAFKEIVEKVWPKTKAELEKGIKSAQKILSQGKKYLEKEKLYYNLGKLVAQTEKSQWAENKKIQEVISHIHSLERQIAKTK